MVQNALQVYRNLTKPQGTRVLRTPEERREDQGGQGSQDVGQGVYSNKYMLLADDKVRGGHWTITKSTKDLYPHKGFMVTGSGADPAFAIV